MPFNPITNPVDYIVLADQRSPGIAEVLDAASLREWIERGGYGVTGGFSLFKRKKIAHFQVAIRLYTVKHWTDWHAWKVLVDRIPSKRGGSSPASGYLRIEHPILADLDIKAVGVEKISQPRQTDNGEWTIIIDFIEFRDPKPTQVKPEATKPVPVDPYEEQIKKLNAENKALADELAK